MSSHTNYKYDIKSTISQVSLHVLSVMRSVKLIILFDYNINNN